MTGAECICVSIPRHVLNGPTTHLSFALVSRIHDASANHALIYTYYTYLDTRHRLYMTKVVSVVMKLRRTSGFALYLQPHPRQHRAFSGVLSNEIHTCLR